MSWDEAFSRRYDEWSAQMTEDVAFYVELAREADGPLVELGIGNGRVAIPVAQATGQPVIGIDSSPAMLERARVRAAEAGVEVDLREGDMRHLALDEPAAPHPSARCSVVAKSPSSYAMPVGSADRWPDDYECGRPGWPLGVVEIPGLDGDGDDTGDRSRDRQANGSACSNVSHGDRRRARGRDAAAAAELLSDGPDHLRHGRGDPPGRRLGGRRLRG